MFTLHEDAARTFANSPLSECLWSDVPGSVRPLLITRGGPDTFAALGELGHKSVINSD
jgi:hypothetical protein